jgi:hypothetical protein
MAIEREAWDVAGKLLKVGVSDTRHRQVVKEASKRAGDWDFIKYILPHCTGAHLESALPHLVSRRLWKTVGLVLERVVSDTQHTRAVEEASKTADEWNFIYNILPHCTGAHLESALPHLVSRGLWKSVGLVLERGVSDTQHTWAVEEVSKTAEDQDFIKHILPHCTSRGGIKIFKALARLASNSKYLLAKSEKNSPK